MNLSTFYAVAADVVLSVHVSIVLFIVLGLVLVLCGWVCRWHWVRNPWFRTAHLICIGIVVVQSWLGVICPLTTLEMHLRSLAGQATYSGSFIGHWLNSLLYYDAPWWVFMVAYTVFGGLVVATWVWVRPRAFGQQRPATTVEGDPAGH